jgi:hypothetical protein
MPRFFFHLDGMGPRVDDDQGEEFASQGAAESHNRQVARETNDGCPTSGRR